MQVFKIVGLLLLAGVLAGIALVLLKVAPRIQPTMPMIVSSFEECAAAGNPIMESYPRQCRAQDGQLFIEELDLTIGTTTHRGGVQNHCAVAGCSRELCVPAGEAGNVMTICLYRAEYACYKDAICEPQADGACGWTENAKLTQCLTNPPESDAEMELEVL